MGAPGEGIVVTASEPTPLCSPVAGDRLSEEEMEDLMAWMRNALGSRVTNVKVRPPRDWLPWPLATTRWPACQLWVAGPGGALAVVVRAVIAGGDLAGHCCFYTGCGHARGCC